MKEQIASRQTKYCTEIEQLLSRLGHATNAELLESMRKTYPTLSATTVHRATARLAERGQIAIAPKSTDGSLRYDINTKPHDHFMCIKCGILKDAYVKEKVRPVIEDSIDGCSVSGNLTISGVCKLCKTTGS